MKIPLLFFSLFFCFILNAQIPTEKTLLQQYASADNDVSRIMILGKLAEIYSVFRDNKKADSILQKQMRLAEFSQDNNLITQTISGKAIDNIASWSSRETFEQATQFIQSGLDYAKENDNARLEAISYLKLAGLYRKRSLADKAIEQTTHALLLLSNKNDSLKAAMFLELGDCFLSKGDAVAAYRNYNNAYDVSYSLHSVPLQSDTWHRFARLYLSLGDSLLSKNALLQSQKLNKSANRAMGLFTDYTALFRQTDEIEFLARATEIANKKGTVGDRLLCKRLMLSYIMVVEKNSDKAIAYLKQNPDLELYEKNKGLPNYSLGTIYQYGGRYKEAIQYYLLDEPIITKAFNSSVQLSLFTLIGECYQNLNQTDKAILYYEKAFNLGETNNNPHNNAQLTAKLSNIYLQKSNYQQALHFVKLSQQYNEDIKALAKQREVTLLGLEREKKRHEKDLQEIADKEVKKRNLQYIGISLGIAFLFLVMLIFGMFPVSKLGIRMLNFFAFICLFEFIILLIDNWLHHQTHGEPLKIWVAKIFIIAILLPLHHYMEHLGLKFLDSQKLIRLRQKLKVRNLWHPSKKTLVAIEKDLEESTLV